MLKKTLKQGVNIRLAVGLLSLVYSVQQPVSAQRVEWDVTGTTEGLWNITDGKTGWCNLLEANAGIRLWKGAGLKLGAISTYGVNLPVANDLQAFSCLDAGPNKVFRLIQAGISQEIGSHFLIYAGLRNIDMDHFTTPFTSLFTNASHGNFPILSANFPLATYPLAALCLHTEYSPTEGLLLRESVYNGVASDRLNRQFRVRPSQDGFFNIGSLSYFIGEEEHHHGHYTIGYALGSSPTEEEPNRKTFNYALWSLVEQPFVHIGQSHLAGIFQGGLSPKRQSECRGYWGAGLILSKVSKHDYQFGIMVNRAFYANDRETDVELTGSFPICRYLTLQPAIHCINTNGSYTAATQFRAVIEI